MKAINSPAVAEAFERFPKHFRDGLLGLRQLIFDTAEGTQGVGRLEETLKWGQPSYVTPETRSGSTLRLGVTKDQRYFGLYVHCQTNILSYFRDRFPNAFRYEGERAVLFEEGEDLQPDKLRHCIIHGLTYHQKNRRRMAE